MPAAAGEVKARAAALGFIACGVTHPGPPPHGDRLDDWLAKGYAGTMRYLQRQSRRRKDPRLIVPEALSVVVVLDNYYSASPEDQPAPRVARYALGEDYHKVTKDRITRLADFIKDAGATVARVYTDAGPVPERELAQRAGLGWIGKNTMLIRPGVGSFFFIGSIFTDLALEPDAPFEADHCGTCTRCLDACPTDAFVEPRVLDATRCISYLTIEHKGPIPEPAASRLDGWVFGCDICNEVCPWNQRFAVPGTVEAFRSREALARADARFFERMSEEEFDRRFGDTPLERPGLEGMRRNFRAAFGGKG
jgi:epoxyqueuosine reductase